ncbi:MAG: redoxin domain-containing protein [Desulfobacterales bacterium]|nr:MAG: redoxin domain-containing protein [Desulfobacterales bacterium]
MVKLGQKAPAFCLPATAQDEVCLKDCKGKWVVLFFYVKDSTSG